jgi:hypothetical protein
MRAYSFVQVTIKSVNISALPKALAGLTGSLIFEVTLCTGSEADGHGTTLEVRAPLSRSTGPCDVNQALSFPIDRRAFARVARNAKSLSVTVYLEYVRMLVMTKRELVGRTVIPLTNLESEAISTQAVAITCDDRSARLTLNAEVSLREPLKSVAKEIKVTYPYVDAYESQLPARASAAHPRPAAKAATTRESSTGSTGRTTAASHAASHAVQAAPKAPAAVQQVPGAAPAAATTLASLQKSAAELREKMAKAKEVAEQWRKRGDSNAVKKCVEVFQEAKKRYEVVMQQISELDGQKKGGVSAPAAQVASPPVVVQTVAAPEPARRIDPAVMKDAQSFTLPRDDRLRGLAAISHELTRLGPGNTPPEYVLVMTMSR